MEMSLQLNCNVAKMGPGVRSRQEAHNNLYCRAHHHVVMLEKKTNFYEVLSLRSRSVGFDEIKKAYKSMALLYHPDVCPPSLKEESTKRFVEVREAYETLSDPVSRRIYDDYMLEWDRYKKNVFPKAVWEKQLEGLRRRSHQRSVRKV
ncbi:hypothetical protein K2173_005277 [Erythroxylum novogranatense]|uniref:J domain-containing protein n=1 Tax=Erythroxylum novogranatense TaxID=1862640 RepID=A0AAV8TUA7_9ROSI|nr:hypothetical protein K2173_005277 [Erythroxylum novogranatense]